MIADELQAIAERLGAVFCDEPYDVNLQELDAALLRLAAQVDALIAKRDALQATLAEAKATLEPVAQRYHLLSTTTTALVDGPFMVGGMTYYVCVPLDDLNRAAEMVAKLKGVPPDGR